MQVQQWFFAASPGHPALRRVCDHIAAHYRHRFSEYSNIDTLERTGPGAWTDAVLATARENTPMVSAALAALISNGHKRALAVPVVTSLRAGCMRSRLCAVIWGLGHPVPATSRHRHTSGRQHAWPCIRHTGGVRAAPLHG